MLYLQCTIQIISYTALPIFSINTCFTLLEKLVHSGEISSIIIFNNSPTRKFIVISVDLTSRPEEAFTETRGLFAPGLNTYKYFLSPFLIISRNREVSRRYDGTSLARREYTCLSTWELCTEQDLVN